MKAFAHITLGEVSNTLKDISQMPNAVSAEFYPEYVNWEAVAEYILETFGNEYDDDDIRFVHDNVWFNGETLNIYVLEVYDDEHLVIETIYNPRA